MVTVHHGIEIDMDALAEICHRYHVKELSLFGSVLREDFDDDSDVDVLVEYQSGASVSLFDMSDLKLALEQLIGRSVDLIEKLGLKPVIREHVLKTAEILIAD